MSTTRSPRTVTAAQLVAFASCVAMLAVPLASPAEPRGLSEAQRLAPERVELQQIGFELSGGRYPHTDWGRLVLDRRELRPGYLNVVTCQPGGRVLSLDFDRCGWSVQNLRIAPVLFHARGRGPSGGRREAAERPPLTVYLDLYPKTSDPAERVERARAGGPPVGEIRGVVLLTARPLFREEGVRRALWLAEGDRLDVFPVSPAVVSAEGDLGEEDRVESLPPPPDYLLLLGLPPAPPDPFPAPGPPGDLASAEEVYRDPAPNQHSAENQCVTIAHANNLQYLAEVTPHWSVAFPHDRGFAIDPNPDPDDVGSALLHEPADWSGTPCDELPACPLVAVIDAFARREEVQSANTGEGTGRCQQIRGLFGFLRNLELQGEIESAAEFVTLRHQGSSATYGQGESCHADLLPEGLVSSSEGQFVDWEWMRDQLLAGRGVVCTYGRYSSMDPDTRERNGGHMQALWGVHRLNGQDTIFMLDDGKQGSSFLNGSLGLGLPAWQIEDLNADGRPNLDGTAKELEFCLSVEAIPQPNPGGTL